MAVTAFGDVTANGLFVGAQANETAYRASNILRSGFVRNASVAGSYSPATKKVQFPVWNFAGVTKQTLPTDGTAVSRHKASFAYVEETVTNSIVSVEYQEAAVLTGVGGVPNFMTQLGGRVGQVLATDVEDGLVTNAIAVATAKSMVVSDFDAENLSYNSLASAASSKWGAHWRPSDTAILIHSAVHGFFMQDEDYKRAFTAAKQDLSTGPFTNFMGMSVVVTDAIPVASGVYDNILCSREALQVYMNGNLRLKDVHIPGSDNEVMDAIYSFATHITRSHPCPVLVLKTTAAAPVEP